MTQDKLCELLARGLAPIAWAAIGNGDTLAQRNRRMASLRHADAVFAALHDAGIAIVPKEPSEAMQLAGATAGEEPRLPPWNGTDVRPVTAHIYRAILSAGDLLGGPDADPR